MTKTVAAFNDLHLDNQGKQQREGENHIIAEYMRSLKPCCEDLNSFPAVRIYLTDR
jgi:hypothetical protein